VEIVPDALPDLVLDGHVTRVGESFTSKAGDIVYAVEIALDDMDSALRWGMTVEATFLTE